MIVRVDLGGKHEVSCLARRSRASCAIMGRCVCLSISMIAILMLFETSQAQDPNPWEPNRQETVYSVKGKTRFLKNTKAKGFRSGKSTKQGENGFEDPVWPVGPSWGTFAPTFTPSASDSSWTGDQSVPVAYSPSATPTSFLTTAPGTTPIPSSAYPPTNEAEGTAPAWPTPDTTVQPTALPINPPTGGAEDTAQPWPVPGSTGNPTPSPLNPLPTTSPAASPTRYPTVSPTVLPISSPSGYPTASPTASPGGIVKPVTASPGTSQPTPMSPSGSIGQTPSPMIPTIAGGDENSGRPSPSTKTQDPVSPQPVDSNVETQGSIEVESGLVSSCKEGPPRDGPSTVTTTVKYEYVALISKGAEFIQVLASVEEGTHKMFTTELLICDFSRRLLQENPSYTAVYSIPLDQWNPDKACVDAPENQDCYIVNGGATFEHLPGTSESALEDQVGGILADNYDGGLLDDVHEDLLGLNFVSFFEETTSGNDTSGDDDPAGGGVDDGAKKSASSVSVGGTVAITIAAIGLVVVGLLMLRRRRSGSKSVYVEAVDDKGFNDTMLDDGNLLEDFSSHEAPMANILNDELDDESSYLHLERSYDLAQFDQNIAHDADTCDSLTCAICRELNIALQPVFVDTGVDLTLSYTEELRPELLSPLSSDRIYSVPNTVIL